MLRVRLRVKVKSKCGVQGVVQAIIMWSLLTLGPWSTLAVGAGLSGKCGSEEVVVDGLRIF